MAETLVVQPGGRLQGNIRVPGDKSISHRAVMLTAIAEGVSEINGFLPGEDCLATVAALRQLGVVIEQPAADQLIVHGVGLNGLKASSKALNLGNSGTSMRLLAGLLSAQPFNSRLTGDASLHQRPMARIVNPLRAMGAEITMSETETPPLGIQGNTKGLVGIDYTLPVASAQVKSGLLLAGLYASGLTRITESAVTRDHTERMLTTLGQPIIQKNNGAEQIIHDLNPVGVLRGAVIDVPGDISSAAFFLVGASITPGSDLTLQRVGLNPTRTGVIDILQRMGSQITVLKRYQLGNEPVADLRIRGQNKLMGITIPAELVPLAIDEFPALFIAAACAEGETHLTNACELRVKESDRLAVMAEGLEKLGVKVTLFTDGLTIQGGSINGGQVDSQGDHRIAMAFVMAGLVAKKSIIIEHCATIATSFPNFAALAKKAGVRLA